MSNCLGKVFRIEWLLKRTEFKNYATERPNICLTFTLFVKEILGAIIGHVRYCLFCRFGELIVIIFLCHSKEIEFHCSVQLDQYLLRFNVPMKYFLEVAKTQRRTAPVHQKEYLKLIKSLFFPLFERDLRRHTSKAIIFENHCQFVPVRIIIAFFPLHDHFVFQRLLISPLLEISPC